MGRLAFQGGAKGRKMHLWDKQEFTSCCVLWWSTQRSSWPLRTAPSTKQNTQTKKCRECKGCAVCVQVICWRYGQGSRVHNHADSHCWLTVLQGWLLLLLVAIFCCRWYIFSTRSLFVTGFPPGQLRPCDRGSRVGEWVALLIRTLPC